MDQSSSDLEFFDFKNSSDEEIKEIQAILKGPGSNGCVELPWEIPVSNNSDEGLPETAGASEIDSAVPPKSVEDAVIDSGVNYAHIPTPQLPPAVETFVTLPTTAVPYQNAPYFVSRTIPYLRAYPPMGLPFFACPLPPGEANPYGQFLPMNAAAEPPEAGSSETSTDKKAEDPAVPLVPLPPPSTFAVAGYPPGLHTLPYAGQPTSMYYVPVFNHPYGGYHMPSPPVPVVQETTDDRVVENDSGVKPADRENVDRADTREKLGEPLETIDQVGECNDSRENPSDRENFDRAEFPSGREAPSDSEPSKDTTSNVQQGDDSPAKTTDLFSLASSSGEESSPSYRQEVPPDPVAPSLCLRENVPSNASHPEPVVCPAPRAKVDKGLPKTVPSDDRSSEPVVRSKIVKDPSRCWADLFKGEVNGIDPHPQRSTIKKDITNGKVCSMPVNH